MLYSFKYIKQCSQIHLFFVFSHSGKTIPNGTDKNQLETAENEGKL